MYQQIYATAVGSPVFVVVATLVMEDVEASASVNPPFFWEMIRW